MGIFGSKDDQPASATDNTGVPAAYSAVPDMSAPAPAAFMTPPAMPAPMPSLGPQPFQAPAAPSMPAAPAMPAANSYIMTPAPEPAVTPAYPTEMSSPAISAPSTPVEPSPVGLAVADPSVPDISPPSEGGDLTALKQQALQQLSPLVNHLQQSPEERFQTTMMMLQATDDQSLIKVAYDVAQEITDEQARAQALLDVINEINYFTQHKN